MKRPPFPKTLFVQWEDVAHEPPILLAHESGKHLPPDEVCAVYVLAELVRPALILNVVPKKAKRAKT
jgi:hypothetical protein